MDEDAIDDDDDDMPDLQDVSDSENEEDDDDTEDINTAYEHTKALGDADRAVCVQFDFTFNLLNTFQAMKMRPKARGAGPGPGHRRPRKRPLVPALPVRTSSVFYSPPTLYI
jgi:hypothetical protein